MPNTLKVMLKGRIPVFLVKEDHIYLFLYIPGNEKNLFHSMLATTRTRCNKGNLTTGEVMGAIREFNRLLEWESGEAVLLTRVKRRGWKVETRKIPG